MTDYYKILGISKDASQQEIKAAFRKMSKLCHPDLFPGEKVKEEQFKQINEANEILSDPLKRREYDESVRAESARESSSSYQGGNSNYGQTSDDEREDSQNAYNSARGSTQETGSYYNGGHFDNSWFNKKEFYEKWHFEKAEETSSQKFKNLFRIYRRLIIPLLAMSACFCIYFFMYCRSGLAGQYKLETLTTKEKTETAKEWAKRQKMFKKMKLTDKKAEFGRLVIRRDGSGVMTLRGESKKITWNTGTMKIMNVSVPYSVFAGKLTVTINKTTTLVFVPAKTFIDYALICALVIVFIISLNTLKKWVTLRIRETAYQNIKGVFAFMTGFAAFLAAEIVPFLFVKQTFFEKSRITLGQFNLDEITPEAFALALLFACVLSGALNAFRKNFVLENDMLDCIFGFIKGAVKGAFKGVIACGIAFFCIYKWSSYEKYITIIFAGLFTLYALSQLLASTDKYHAIK